MTTKNIIIHIFYHVDNAMPAVPKVPQASLYPSEVVTIGILFACKGGRFRAFCCWLRRDYVALLRREYVALFGGLADRTTLLHLLPAV